MSQDLISSDLKNLHKLDADHLASIAACFAALSKLDAKLPEALTRYIVDGDGEEVLLKLNGKEVADLLGIGAYLSSNSKHPAAKVRKAALNRKQPVAAQVWVRFAQVLERIYVAAGIKHTVPTGWPSWLGVLFLEIGASQYFDQRPDLWPVDEMEGVFLEAGLSSESLVRFLLDKNSYSAIQTSSYIAFNAPCETLGQLDRFYLKNSALVRKFIESADGEQQAQMFKRFKQITFDPTKVADLIVKASLDSRSAREAALPLMMDLDLKGRPEFRPEIEKILYSGNAGQRNEAVALLWKLYGAAATDTLKKHLENESTDRVKQSINKLIAAANIPQESEEKFELPELEVESGLLPLDQEVKDKLTKHLLRGYENTYKIYQQQLKDFEDPEKRKWMQKPIEPLLVDEQFLTKLFDFVEGKSEKVPTTNHEKMQTLSYQSGRNHEWVVAGKTKLMHVLRVCYAFKQLFFEGQHELTIWDSSPLLLYRTHCQPDVSLREIDAAIAKLPHGRPGLVAKTYMREDHVWGAFASWDDEQVWPIFAEYPEALRQPFSPQSQQGYGYQFMRQNAFRVLAMFPKVPAEFVPQLWEIALGETKAERLQAQEALKSLPNKTASIVVALGDGKQNIRAVAAEWLGRIGDPSAIAPLKSAFLKEKNEAVKGALLIALDKLKANVDEFLNRDELLKEAKAGLAKKLPKGSQWVPLDTLPKLHWSDSGQEVDPDIVKWWVVQSIQQKTPVCTPLMRRYLMLCRKAETEVLAAYVLSSWISYDIETPPAEVCAERARNEADKEWPQMAKHQFYIDMYKDKNGLTKYLFNQYSQELLHSAIDQRGMLAIVSAAGDAACVKMAEQYIRRYFGNKLAHCKALIEVLAWIDLPVSLQALLSIANRFRTKALRQLAEEHVQAIADRQGWTIDELADRTIPDAGFARPLDEIGEPIGYTAILELDYGPRDFLLQLNDQLEPIIFERGGAKPLKALPAPSKTDDEEKAKEAKKIYSDAKKTVKDVVKRQTERLYEALCTQRLWHFDDWERYLAQHPIVGKLCSRLVWVAFQPGKQEAREYFGSFRPLEDGSLSTEDDEQLLLPANSLIAVAHACNTPAELAEKWAKHLKDYDVTALFAQFGRDIYSLPEAKSKDSMITDFEGHMISSFKLRSKANKLGYNRGETGDGGSFNTYHKPFPSLSIQAVIEFTGSFVPEEDIPTALQKLYFSSTQQQNSYNMTAMSLNKVPAVLLSECYNDLKQIAADGTGFDKDWEKKSYY